MRLFGKTTYDRAETLERAAKAQGRGQRKKAIAEYRKVLEQEPENPAVLGKLAVLLAQTKQLEEARQRFVAAAEVYEKQAFDDKALATYLQAAGYLPRRVELWERIAKLHVKRDRGADATRALLDGSRQLRGKKARASAIRLLREAVKIEPWHFEATFELARLLVKEAGMAQARHLYEGLCKRTRNRQLRRVRGAMFRVSPTPAAAWRWLRAAVQGT